MAAVTKIATSPNRPPVEGEHSRLAETLSLALFVLAVATLLSLASFHPSDASWSVAGASGAPRNWIGKIGAGAADILFQAFGLVAYLVPGLMIGGAIQLFRGRSLRPTPVQLVGWTLLFLSLSGAFSLFPELPFYWDRIRPGGVIGFLLAGWLESGLNKTGAGLLLFLVACISLMMTTAFSLRRTAGRWTETGTPARLRGWWRDISARFSGNDAAGDDQSDDAFSSASGSPAILRQSPPLAFKKPLNSDDAAASDDPPKEKRTWFKSGPKPVPNAPPDDDEAEKARHEQLVVDSLYGDDALDGVGVVTSARPVGASSAAKRADDQTAETSASDVETPVPAIAHRADADALNGGEPLRPAPPSAPEVRSPRKPLSEPKPEPGPPSDTRKLAREAIARSQERRASGENPAIKKDGAREAAPPSLPVPPKSDPVVAKMVESVSIVRRTQTPNSLPRLSPIQERPVAPLPPPPAAAPYELPTVQMLTPPPPRQNQSDEELHERARLLAAKCKEFNVIGEIQDIEPGPVVTTFGFKPDPGVKYSRVVNLVDDLCLGLRAESIRIDRIPGKSTVGIEVPNANREVIHMREIIESDRYRGSASYLTVALGKTINGDPYVSDLARMPHLLIAGSTGSGKSVMVNTLICSVLFKATAADVKMIMVDPKRLELGLYEGIPHLLTPIVTEPKRAANALNWAVTEMENRYKQLAGYGVRNIDQFNREICTSTDAARFPDGPPPKLPYIMIVIDELADLMMVASSDVETAITRLAQMARAVGIHLVVATQRPSVDVITGLIKANFPARISFRVSSKVDSRTILDTNGAEGLLGQGDMLFLPPGTSRLVRIHGSYVGESEINRVVDHIKKQGEPQYDESIQMSDAEVEASELGGGERDELYDQAMRIIVQMGRASTSVLQRRLRIGYGRAAAILDMMESEGYVGPSEGSKPRIVKPVAFEYIEMLDGHALNGNADE
jgi:DNA segregation ATPase FtsK/SpoIIIE, S-DNA-T family